MARLTLTEKQARFVAEYLVDLNATEAAKRAGYSEKTAYSIGFENLKKPEIQEAIQQAKDARAERTSITQDMVLQELARIAFANGTDFAKIVSRRPEKATIIGEDGAPQQVERVVQMVQLMDTDAVSPDKRAAIACIKNGKNGIEVKSYDKLRALELLGQHLGLFDGKPNQTESGENNLLQAIQSVGEIDTDDLPEVQ